MAKLISKELHVCMGLNSCKNNGYSGNNDCAGKGDCSTAVGHPCHTLNSCKGQGGCGLFGTSEEVCYPGQNNCKYEGSCGVPILSSRFVMQGPNKGRSVWLLARARFEEKRKSMGLTFGPAPAPFGPSSEYVSNVVGVVGSHSSCGQSGSRSCSYNPDKTARAIEANKRVAKMQKESASKLKDSLSNCPPDVY
jgi:hypothetical protein